MNDQNSENPAATLLVLIAGVALSGLVLTLFYHYYGYVFEGTWKSFRIIELYIWWGLSHLLFWLSLSPSPSEIMSQIEWLQNPPGGKVSERAKELLMSQWTSYWKWFLPIVVIPSSLFLLANRNTTRLVFIKNSMEGLLAFMAKVHPNLQAYVKENPQDYPLDYKAGADNRYAMRTIPFELALTSPPPGWENHPNKQCRSAPAIFNPELAKGDRFDGDLCERYLSWQVGPRFQGLKKMSSAEKKLFNLFRSEIPPRQRGKIKKILNAHSYTRPILMSLYYEVQSLGSFPTEKFKWLRYSDRVLWYAMTDVGEETPSPESLGAWYHWTMETKLGMPIPEPAVELGRLSLQKMVDVDDDFLDEILEARTNLISERKASGIKYKRDLSFIPEHSTSKKRSKPKRQE